MYVVMHGVWCVELRGVWCVELYGPCCEEPAARIPIVHQQTDQTSGASLAGGQEPAGKPLPGLAAAAVAGWVYSNVSWHQFN